MKKVKKDRKSLGWKIAVSIIVVCVLAVMVSCMIKIWQTQKDAEQIRSNLNWSLMYSETRVSDDGKWYLIPEARMKFPFFVMAHEGVGGTDRPLRYAYYSYSGELEDEKERMFSLHFTYNFTEDSCVDPFIFTWKSEEWNGMDTNAGSYEKVKDIYLADGRAMTLAKNASGSCVAFVEGDMGRLLAEKLKQVKSY